MPYCCIAFCPAACAAPKIGAGADLRAAHQADDLVQRDRPQRQLALQRLRARLVLETHRRLLFRRRLRASLRVEADALQRRLRAQVVLLLLLLADGGVVRLAAARQPLVGELRL
jgi:hypothetical protein